MTESNASAGAGITGPSDTTEQDRMIESLDVAIAEAERKIESGRVYNAEHETVRIKWIRALAYAMNVRRQVVQDRDLQELTERLEELEEMHE